MIVKGKIIEVYPEQHQIVVRYYSDEFPPEPMDANLRPDGEPARCHSDRAITVWETPMPTGAALEQLIADGGLQVKAEFEARLAGRATETPLTKLQAAIADPTIDTSMQPALNSMQTNTEFVVSERPKTAPTVPVFADVSPDLTVL